MEVREFDFSCKEERSASLADVRNQVGEEVYYWIHLDSEEFLDSLPLIKDLVPNSEITPQLVLEDHDEPVKIQSEYLRVVFEEVHEVEGDLKRWPLVVLLSYQFMLTIAPSESHVIARIRKTYKNDFIQFSQSCGFLIFEVVDHLVSTHQEIFQSYERRIEKLQVRLLSNVDNDVFRRVGDITKQLIRFRLVLILAREAIENLATRKSAFVEESTQPFLASKLSVMCRLADDVAVQRSVVSNTLDLYIGFVGYQTNQVINRLTVISVVFLPLTFLVGVYGMNFKHMPEMDWPYSYAVFWGIVVLIITGLLFYFKKKQWIGD